MRAVGEANFLRDTVRGVVRTGSSLHGVTYSAHTVATCDTPIPTSVARFDPNKSFAISLSKFDSCASRAVLDSGHVRADMDGNSSASSSDKLTTRKIPKRAELTRQLRSGSDEKEAWNLARLEVGDLQKDIMSDSAVYHLV